MISCVADTELLLVKVPVAVLGAAGGGGVPDLEIGCGALQQRRVQEGGGREAVDGEVRRGIHTRAVLQVRDPLAQAVEICDEGSGCPTGPWTNSHS